MNDDSLYPPEASHSGLTDGRTDTNANQYTKLFLFFFYVFVVASKDSLSSRIGLAKLLSGVIGLTHSVASCVCAFVSFNYMPLCDILWFGGFDESETHLRGFVRSYYRLCDIAN